jgi:UDPglucose 6-dehydrogenase
MAQKMNRPVLVDGRNVFDPARARAAGFDYVGVGRPSPSMAAGSVQAA